MSLAKRSCGFALALAAVCPSLLSAASCEAVNAGAQTLFWQSAGGSVPRFHMGAAGAGVQGSPITLPQIPNLENPVKPLVLTAFSAVNAGAKQPAKEISLTALLNKHLKTSLSYSLGGKTVWVSGIFDRAQKAYVSVLEEGKAALFFDVENLLTHPAVLDLGNLKYKLSVSPDLTDQLESEIVLTNTANRKDQQRITLREMLAAVSAAGEDATVAGQGYRLFYYDDIKDGQGGAATKSIAFILTDAKGEIHVFLVPAELVPAEKIAVFKMHENKAIGLQQVDGKLRIFDNP